jgi:hypothetical protein
MLVHVLLYRQMYYSEWVVKYPSSLHLFCTFCETSEDRKKGEPRNVTRRITNVNSTTVSASL